ncbi:MAG: phosphoadenosine phosphosulfate reductase family protein [Candidatus Methanoplasma sp.]|jgi:phosphoadenosine phosphosulfate reductase|nr:phosphoadenosine phosphosulfate reductase family protein [Candidatus Methanoplasma sp.]
MARSNAAHGKETLLWCDSCGTLLLGGSCSRCGSGGRAFEINSPGDIRPCMGDGEALVRGLFEDAFGTSSFIDGRMVFLNKLPGEDRADEIVAHGEVVGALRFDLRDSRMRLDLRQAGAEMIAGSATKGVVSISGAPGHLKGKALPGSCVSSVSGEFAEGDPIIIKKGSKTGCGVALSPSDSMREAERALRVRGLEAPAPRPASPPSGRREFVEANRARLESLESSAASDVKSFMRGKRQPLTVSFSGGKDSLAAYGVAARACGPPELLFIDTGLEFPETVEYAERFARENGLALRKAEAGSAFWDNVDSFGPPAKDFRWCCKVCKLGPMADLISREYPGGTVTVEGNRALESFARAKTGFVSKNPFVPGQTNLNPVRSWSAAEVWGYIWMRGLDYNPLYERDFERIGCHLCASCLASEWKNAERLHPGEHGRWEGYLRRYAEERGLPPEYASMGFWRWKSLPPKMLALAGELGLRMEPSRKGEPALRMLKGASPCASGGFSIEAVASFPSARDFSYVGDALSTVGEARVSQEFEMAVAKTREGRARVFGGGQISVTAGSAGEAERVFEKALKAVARAEMCTECGICAKACPRRAIRISGGMRVDPERCNRCGKCEKACMLSHYFDKLMAGSGARHGRGGGRDAPARRGGERGAGRRPR